jgi:hypothetical protein
LDDAVLWHHHDGIEGSPVLPNAGAIAGTAITVLERKVGQPLFSSSPKLVNAREPSLIA